MPDGPCVCPACPAPENSSGQWQLVPEAFASVHALAEGAAVCKKADCRRWCGIVPPKQKPGRKRQAVGGGGSSVAAGVAVDEAQELPRPPFLRSIDEVWGVRCASSLCHLQTTLTVARVSPYLSLPEQGCRPHQDGRRRAWQQAAVRPVGRGRVRHPRQVGADRGRLQRRVRHLVHRPQGPWGGDSYVTGDGDDSAENGVLAGGVVRGWLTSEAR